MFTATAILVLHNVINVRIDAYKITKLNKKIRHGINGAAYLIVVAVLIWLMHLSVLNAILFLISAFVNRQISFDIPLNLKRGLPWDYVTKADPPGSIMDRIEIKLFGRDGATPTRIYAVIFILTVIYQLSYDTFQEMHRCH